MNYQALIFDLDGTILDTLGDIRLAINDALKAIEIPLEYSLVKTKSLVGDGAEALMHRALGDFDTPENFVRLKKEYMPRYEAYQTRHTKPFNGLPVVLKYLQNKGISLFVCTNKPDELAKEIVGKCYEEGLFKEIHGHIEGSPVKPDPMIVTYFINKYGLDPKSCLFVGDSVTDLLTAKNASLPAAIVTWGYGYYKEALLNEADYVIDKPKELARFGDSL